MKRLLACLIVLALAAPALATKPLSPSSQLDRVIGAYRALKSFRSQTTVEVRFAGETMKERSTLVFQRPSLIHWTGQGRAIDGTYDGLLVCDGKVLHKIERVKGKHDKRKPPATLTELSEMGLGVDFQLLLLLDGNRARLVETMGEPVDVGSSGKNLLIHCQRGNEKTTLIVDPQTYLVVGFDLVDGDSLGTARIRYADIGKRFPASTFTVR